MSNPNHTLLLARLPESKRTAAIRSAAQAALTVTENYAARRSELQRSGKLTESGVGGEMRDLLPATIRRLQVAKAPIAALKREIDARRASLRPADPDPANVAAALERGEIRQHLRSLNSIERNALLLTTSDIRLVEAAVSAPPELSGYSDLETVQKVEQRYSELKYPAEIAELATLETLAAEADGIAQVARNGLRDGAMLDPREFERIARKLEEAVWLTQDGLQVCEPGAGPDGAAAYRPATEEDLAIGIKYASVADYLAARVA